MLVKKNSETSTTQKENVDIFVILFLSVIATQCDLREVLITKPRCEKIPGFIRDASCPPSTQKNVGLYKRLPIRFR